MPRYRRSTALLQSVPEIRIARRRPSDSRGLSFSRSAAERSPHFRARPSLCRGKPAVSPFGARPNSKAGRRASRLVPSAEEDSTGVAASQITMHTQQSSQPQPTRAAQGASKRRPRTELCSVGLVRRRSSSPVRVFYRILFSLGIVYAYVDTFSGRSNLYA